MAAEAAALCFSLVLIPSMKGFIEVPSYDSPVLISVNAITRVEQSVSKPELRMIFLKYSGGNGVDIVDTSLPYEEIRSLIEKAL